MKSRNDLPKRYTLTYSVFYDSNERNWTAYTDKIELSGIGNTPEMAIYDLDLNLDKYYEKEAN